MGRQKNQGLEAIPARIATSPCLRRPHVRSSVVLLGAWPKRRPPAPGSHAAFQVQGSIAQALRARAKSVTSAVRLTLWLGERSLIFNKYFSEPTDLYIVDVVNAQAIVNELLDMVANCGLVS